MDPWERLVSLAPPPASPLDAVGEWSEAERRIGAACPHDYRRLVAAYGRGSFGEALCLKSPFAPDVCCHPAQAEEGVLWATSVNGDRLYWRAGSGAAAWEIRVDGRSQEPTTIASGVASCLVNWLEGTLILPELGKNGPYFDASFEPDTPRSYTSLSLIPLTPSFETRFESLLAAFEGARITGLFPRPGGFSHGSFKLPDRTRAALSDWGPQGSRLDLRYEREHQDALRDQLPALLARLGWSVWQAKGPEGLLSLPGLPVAPQPQAVKPPYDLAKVDFCLRKCSKLEQAGAPTGVLSRVREEALSEVTRAREAGWVGSAASLPEPVREIYERLIRSLLP